MFKVKNLILSLLLLTGFFSDAQNGVTISDSITSNSIFRRYRLYVPNTYTGQPVPLVFNLHGYTSNGSQQQAYSNFMPIADTAKFLVVHPEGTSFSGSQYWNAGFGPGANDLLFISDLIDSLSLNYNIDQNRVYSCGMSNGGIMSYHLACYLPNRIAAIASVTGSMLKAWQTCVPNRPFPIMEVHGTNDATVPYNGDATFSHIDSVIKKWWVFNNCNPTPITTNVPDINTSDGATATHYRYTGGTNNAEVELYKINNGAHTWPGAFPIGVTCQDFNASVEIWRFFRKYKLDLLSGLKENSISATVKVFPNPCTNYLFIDLRNAQASHYRILNLYGQNVKDEKDIQASNIKANTDDLSEGIYFIELTLEDRSILLRKFVISR